MAAAAPAETASPAALCLAPKAPVAPWALKAVLVRPGQPAPLGPKASRAYKGPKDLKVSPASLALKACRDCKAHPALLDPKDLRASLGLPGLQAQLLRQYMHNTEIAVTMRLSTILKTIKQPL